MRRVLGLLVIAAALLLAVWPLPPSLVERYYADAFYTPLQAQLSALSNALPFALFDVTVCVVVAAGLWTAVASVRRARMRRDIRPLGRLAAGAVVGAALVYLWFALSWGLNYARPPLISSIPFDAARVTPAALAALTARAAVAVNSLHGDAHRSGFPGSQERPVALARSLHALERRLGRSQSTTVTRPKHSLFGAFFRAAGVDGMHAPFFLETLLNPDLTPPERPAVLAHEWAHLSGYGPEAEASFVGLLAALHADVPAQYSAWLALFDEAASQLPAADQQRAIASVAAGPQDDRRAIAQRLRRRVRPIQWASWQTYDRYLKSQGVREGVQSYSRVVQLLLGTDALAWR